MRVTSLNDNLPYMVAPGLIPKILGKITEARRPERFTQDFLETKLGFSGGSARAIIPLLKRIGFLSPDGVPTRLYDQFRNPDTQGRAMAEAIRAGYKELFDRNEYVQDLSRDKLKALVVEMTGVEKDNRAAEAITSTFFTLKDMADFDAPGSAPEPLREIVPAEKPVQNGAEAPRQSVQDMGKNFGLNVAYTINLNLPETTNPDVFNAIFRALKEHLLNS
jgi:uncharacterized protein DUF5343